MTTPAPNASLPRDLGGGLMLRRATPADIAPLEAWSAAVFHPTAGAHQRYIMEGHTPHGTLLLGHPDDGNDAAFPDLTFTELLLGYRSLAELIFAHADCRVRGELAPALLDVLFPKRTSHLAFG